MLLLKSFIMNIIKKLIFGFVAFLATLVVASFFVPDKFTVKRAIYINAPIGEVFEQVNDLRNWNNWHSMHNADSNWNLQYQFRYLGEGAGYIWKGNPETVGSGSLEIVSSDQNEEVVVNIHFDQKDQDVLSWYLFEKEGRGTNVSFIMDFDVGLDPFEKLTGLRLKWRTNRSFDYGLDRLKEITEATTYTRQNQK